MKHQELTQEQFLKDIRGHQPYVLLDEGVHRHILFKRPGTGCMHFRLTTWEDYLTISGDMGTLTFQRTMDMFRFFRHYSEDGSLNINPGYWSEKIEGIDYSGRDSILEWDSEAFESAVKERYDDWLEQQEFSEEELNDDESDASALVEEMRDSIDTLLESAESEHEAWCAVDDFSAEEGILSDFWETSCKRYKNRYLWLCYAIQWGIMRYDVQKMAQAAVNKLIVLKG